MPFGELGIRRIDTIDVFALGRLAEDETGGTKHDVAQCQRRDRSHEPLHLSTLDMRTDHLAHESIREPAHAFAVTLPLVVHQPHEFGVSCDVMHELPQRRVEPRERIGLVARLHRIATNRRTPCYTDE